MCEGFPAQIMNCFLGSRCESTVAIALQSSSNIKPKIA